MTKLMAFSGFRKSGKTFTADFLVNMAKEQYDLKVQKLSFADSLRIQFSEYKNIPIEFLTNNQTKENYRQEIITFASWIRANDPIFFIRETFKLIDMCDFVIIDDLRTIEEFRAVVEFGGKPFRIFASPEIRRDRGWIYAPSIDNDLTETEMDLSAETYFRFGGKWIYNNHGVKPEQPVVFELKAQLDKILRNFLTS